MNKPQIRRVLKDISPWVYPGLPLPQVITLARVLTMVSNYYKIPEDKIKTKTRVREIVQCRHIYYYLASVLTLETAKNIGDYCSNDDWVGGHCVCIHGRKTATTIMSVDKAYRNDIESIRELITGEKRNL